MNYKEFLKKKPLFYEKIDYSRMPRIWEKIKQHFKLPKIIHIIGTNGKGTTGRFLAYMLHQRGLGVGHYTSPHILEFNERIWKNEHNVDDKHIEDAHLFLQNILDDEDIKSLSYFEYTTLIALFLFQECDYALLEAGMGGEYDATSVFGNDMSIITPIDFDHQEFLGDTIEKIASTKLKSIQKYAIIGRQKYDIVYEIAKELSKKRDFKFYRYTDFVDEKTRKLIEEYAKKESLPKFLKENLSLAVSAYRYLGYDIENDTLKDMKIFGRCQKIAKNITIDVGHNVLAAEAIKECFMGKKVILIYNSYKDKDYRVILQKLKPIIKRVEILKVNNERIEEEDMLKKNISDLGIEVSSFDKISKDSEYLVFGSFSVVEEFMKYKGYV